MPIKIVKLHHVGIRIAEGADALKAAEDFYGDVLGVPTAISDMFL